jgi:hypothetical protein
MIAWSDPELRYGLDARLNATRSTPGFFAKPLTEGATMECISYKDGYKYQLKGDYVADTGITPDAPIDTEYLAMSIEGMLTVRNGYAWDGPSGPTIDTLNFMRGSLVHDALYQLIREGHLASDTYREAADRLLQTMCKEDGMTALRAWGVYQGVRLGGGPAADPASNKPLIRAPEACQ